MKKFKLLLTVLITALCIGCPDSSDTIDDVGGGGDTTRPVIESVSIAEKELTGNRTIVLTGSPTNLTVVITATDAGGSGISGYQIVTSETPTETWEVASTSPITITNHPFSDGENQYIWIKDNAGNKSDRFMITVEKDAAALVIDTVTIGGTVVAHDSTIGIVGNTQALDVVIKATAGGGRILSGYQITPDSTSTETWKDAISSPITITNHTFTHGETQYIWVKDNAGNKAGFKVTAETDTTAPVIDTVTISGTAVAHAGTISIAGASQSLEVVITATDTEGSGVSEYQITTAETPTETWKTIITSPITIVAHPFIDGETQYIWVKDDAGNKSDRFMVTAGTAKTEFYVSSGGLDTASGTESAPLKTIEKAITLLPATGGTILVMNDITIAATIEIAKGIILKNSSSVVTLKRGSGFAGALLNVTRENLTLKNITIDGQGGVRAGVVTIGKGVGGNSATGAGKDIKVEFSTQGEGTVEATSALITVAAQGNLTLTGATLQNNKNTSTTNFGGGIFNEGIVTINGGTITGNRAIDGGGIYVDGSGTVNLGAGSAIKISGNISRYIDNNEMIKENQILGANTTEKISNGYIPFFANNIAYTNTTGSPIKVIGTLAGGTKIGLSPTNWAKDAVLVEKESDTITPSHFSFGTVSGDLIVGTHGTGDTGPGSGTVFFCNEARYEISGLVPYKDSNKMAWTDAATAIATYNTDSIGGQSDWFFPMIDVLGVVCSSNLNTGSSSSWSSSSSSLAINVAWGQVFTNNGNPYTNGKIGNDDVRVVRGF